MDSDDDDFVPVVKKKPEVVRNTRCEQLFADALSMLS